MLLYREVNNLTNLPTYVDMTTLLSGDVDGIEVSEARQQIPLFFFFPQLLYHKSQEISKLYPHVPNYNKDLHGASHHHRR